MSSELIEPSPLVSPAFLAYKLSKGEWQPADHLLLLNKYLVEVATGKIKNLMIFMPPRHGKSELTSKYFPAWYLSRFPNKRVILTSYEADFAASWGYKVRDLVHEYGKSVLGIQLSPDSSARDDWNLYKKKGGMVTAGVGGAITGKGADLFIIDDPVKNSEQANSKTYQEKALDWYKSTAHTRLEPDGSMIIIQTRWNDADLSGALLSEEPDKWTVISLPAFAEENDLLGRKPGEPLFKERFPANVLEDIKKTIGPYWFSALYQQRPQATDSALFKREHLRFCRVAGGLVDFGYKVFTFDQCRIIQTCDPAASLKTTADYFVLGTWAITPDNDLVLLDLIRLRLESPDQVKLFWHSYMRWKPESQYVETVGLGKTLFQHLKKEGLPVKEVTPGTADKYTRALPAAARMSAGTVYIADDGPWRHDFIDELLSFPTGAHDDQVDVLSYAVQVLIESSEMYQGFSLERLIVTKTQSGKIVNPNNTWYINKKKPDNNTG